MLWPIAHHTRLHEGGCRVEANDTSGWDFFDHRNRCIDAQPARTPPNNVGAQRGFAALHDAHAALAITADYALCIDYLV